MLQQILTAQERLRNVILKTPVLEDPSGSGPLLKAEHLQRTGSFKLRGAANRVIQAVQAGASHVVTGSSGNHGQAVAYIAHHLGIRATVVVPETAPALKVRLIRSHGAAVEFYGSSTIERLTRAEQIAHEQGGVFIPSYDDLAVIAGQGTIGLEILEQVPDIEAIYAPIGGGGLLAGIAVAIKEHAPQIRVIGVEPELGNDTYLSLQQGAICSIQLPQTVADGLRATQPGTLTFSLIQRYVDEIVLVSEDEIRSACRHLLEQVKQVVEPSGATSFAAARRHSGRTVAVISGGNIECPSPL